MVYARDSVFSVILIVASSKSRPWRPLGPRANVVLVTVKAAPVTGVIAVLTNPIWVLVCKPLSPSLSESESLSDFNPKPT